MKHDSPIKNIVTSIFKVKSYIFSLNLVLLFKKIEKIYVTPDFKDKI
jgi:hypothetical protein